MQPAKTPQPTNHTLEDIRRRKDELLDQLQTDKKEFSTLWSGLFVKRENASRGDYIASMVTNSVTIIDLFLLYRKLKKTYGGVFSLFRRKKG